MAKPRGRYNARGAAAGRADAAVPAGGRRGAGLVLIAPFPKRAHGLTPAEVALVQAVAGHLRNCSTAPDGPCWIDANTGSTTAGRDWGGPAAPPADRQRQFQRGAIARGGR